MKRHNFTHASLALSAPTVLMAMGSGKPLVRHNILFIITGQTQFLQSARTDGKRPTVYGRILRSKQFEYCVYNTN